MKLTKRQIDNAVEVTVQGITCLAHIAYYHKHIGSFSRSAPSDLDFHGYTEIDFSLHDLEGNPLELALTQEETEYVEHEICNSL